MNIGIVYPQTEFSHDPHAIGEFAQTVEGLGFTHILAYEHVLGANPDRPGGWQGPYTYVHAFMEPFVLFSFMAAITKRIEFTMGILILPQRQTALVAKQSATLDVLCGGRLRLGIGLGWNPVEYSALNANFHNRGKRVEEQVEVLRLLWTQPLVTYKGNWHIIEDAGLNPMPVQRPIPIWFGGHAEAVLKRIAMMGDGWMPNYSHAAEALPSLEKIYRYREEAGRSKLPFGLEARIRYGEGKAEDWLKTMREWEKAGATHISFNTMGCGFNTPQAHLNAIQAFARALEYL